MPDGINVKGAVPYITSNADFYRIDTALRVPQVTTAEWQLNIHGMVDRPRTLTWADLNAMAATERAVTLTCVSNEIGGDL
ncbi:molybdopterin-dependent oxidoreductase, partial [Pseudomonas aeruginosa]|uniref:molybdopterin-dependent oxidoreductase n=1 Tax=Pseudomonas aeruginosa TaxID=287 RepID=UPI002885B71E